ncbi:UNVERIFIED_CONTAM: hypothetical protein Sradi_1573700 [Sesamum radiatum]|uniref:Retrovirus-related Pol polyprotein from transposon TNT 1-94-like beta-barrel domain-containing protein n=1 Tax=Sesamum radiatum TaxID=300843 RepID=A0AAW2U9W4_SESRA
MMGVNTQQFGTRFDNLQIKVNEVNVSSIYDRLVKLMSLVERIVDQEFQQVETYRICNSTGHPTDLCPMLQEETIEDANTIGGLLDHHMIPIPTCTTQDGQITPAFAMFPNLKPGYHLNPTPNQVKKDCRLKGNDQANCIKENHSSDQLFYTCNSVAEIGDATLYIDSAASNHMTYNKGALQKLDKPFKTNVKLEDNHIVKVGGKGSVAINTRKGMRVINDVMYIPNLRTNLFSVRQTIEKGYTLQLEEIRALFMTTKIKTLILAKVRMKEHRCFPIQLQYLGGKATKAQEDQSSL